MLKEHCMQYVSQYNYTLCGTLIPEEFEPPELTPEQNKSMSEEEKKDFEF